MLVPGVTAGQAAQKLAVREGPEAPDVTAGQAAQKIFGCYLHDRAFVTAGQAAQKLLQRMPPTLPPVTAGQAAQKTSRPGFPISLSLTRQRLYKEIKKYATS